jgi:hypothetical protein
MNRNLANENGSNAYGRRLAASDGRLRSSRSCRKLRRHRRARYGGDAPEQRGTSANIAERRPSKPDELLSGAAKAVLIIVMRLAAMMTRFELP